MKLLKDKDGNLIPNLSPKKIRKMRLGDQFNRFQEVSIYLADLNPSDCAFLPSHWPRQYDYELDVTENQIKFILTYNYGKASPWVNLALA